MGRYHKYKKPKPKRKKLSWTIRDIVFAVLLLITITGFIIQIVMNF